jgi:hypothetical protein
MPAHAHRIVIPLAAAAVLSGAVAVAVASAPSETSSAAPSYVYRGPVATASGAGAADLVYPTLVDVHLDRSEAALDRAATLVDRGKPAKAAPEVEAASAQVAAAWRATKYVIRKTPPPPPPGDRAGASGGAPAGPSYASPPDTSLAVLTLQHDVIGTALGLAGADATLDATLLHSMQTAADARDHAIAFIHRVAPPPPPPGDRAGASGGAIVASFDATMPSVLPILDDEIQALKGTRALTPGLSADLTTAIKGLVRQDRRAQDRINAWWPPVVGD